jgi:hypothetical protein
MTQGAGDAHPCQHVLAIDGFNRALKTYNGVQLQQCDRGVGSFQIDSAVLNARYHRRWQCFRIDLQTDRQGGRGVDCRPDHLVHSQCVSPLCLVAQRIEAEDLLAPRNLGLIVSIRVARAGAEQRSRHAYRAQHHYAM